MKDHPGRLEHHTPDWVFDGFKFHIRIRADPGQNLTHPPIARGLLDSAKFYSDMKAWWYSLFLLMPDHIHGIIVFPLNVRMSRVIANWKSYTRHAYGIRWQSNYFDCRLRTAEDADEAWHYIRRNPVRARLCARPDDWPWWSGTSGHAGLFDKR